MSSYHPGTWKVGAAGIAAYYEDMTAECSAGQALGYWSPYASQFCPALKGTVQLAHFAEMARGKHPETKQPLTAMLKRGRRAVLETVCSAPKSFSVAALVGKDERITAMFEKAVAETMEEVGRFAAVRVRSGGRDDHAPARGLVFASFSHDISRAQDPALHVHCPVFNATRNFGARVDDSRNLALESREIFARQRFFSALLDSKLAEGARELGYNVKWTKTGPELADIPANVCRLFSKGSAKIDEASAKLTGSAKPHAAVRSILAWQVRAEKAPVSAEALQQSWTKELGAKRLAQVQAVVTEARQNKRMAISPSLEPKTIVAQALAELTDRHTIVADHIVEAKALQMGQGHIDLHRIRHQLSPEVAAPLGLLATDPDAWGARRYSTREALAAEEAILDEVNDAVGLRRALVPAAKRKVVLAQVPETSREAVETLLSSRDEVMVLTADREGIEQVQQALQAAQVSTVVFDPAKELRVPHGAVVSVEAKHLTLSSARRLLTNVRRAKGRLLVLGGGRKAPSRLVGQLLRHTRTTRTVLVCRQPEKPWEVVQDHARDRQPASALNALARLGGVAETSDPAAALARWVIENDGLAVVANEAQARELTAQIRAQAKLGSKVVQHRFVETMQWSPKQKLVAANYKIGDELRENRLLCLPSARMRVAEIRGSVLRLEADGKAVELDLANPPHGSRWAVSRPRSIEIRSGDRLLIGDSIEKVVAINAKGQAVLSDGAVLEPGAMASHGWALPASRAVEHDRVGVLASEALGRSAFCSALEKAQENAKLFTQDYAGFRASLLRRKSPILPQRTALALQSRATHLARTSLASRQSGIEKGIAPPGTSAGILHGD